MTSTTARSVDVLLRVSARQLLPLFDRSAVGLRSAGPWFSIRGERSSLSRATALDLRECKVTFVTESTLNQLEILACAVCMGGTSHRLQEGVW
jgi:hypothetical protein